MKCRINLTWFLAMIVIVVGISNADLNYEMWENQPSVNALPDFDALGTPADTGTTTDLVAYIEDIDPVNDAKDLYYVRFTGYIDIAESGEWTFYTNSDDGSKLYIEGVEIVDNDGDHGPRERSGDVTLSKGRYAITITFYEDGGGDMLEARYSGPGVAKTLIPNSVLFLTRSSAYDPSPIDGTWFRDPVTELSWKLPESLTGGVVTCDVLWLDGDPNLPWTTSELLVTGEAVESVSLGGRADAHDYYWWQVICYDPNFAGPPTQTDGFIWTFSTDRDTAMVFVDEIDGTVVAEQDETSDTYNVSLSSEPVSPVTITTYAGDVGVALTPVPVIGGNNDAEEDWQSNGQIDLGSSDLELGWDGGADQIVGVRFQDIQLPAGTVIASATVVFTTDRTAGTEDESCYLTIYGRLSDPGEFTSDAYSLSTPTIEDETTAEVEWTMLESDTSSHWTQGQATASSTSPNLATIVQEIIDQPSWASGNALVLLFENGNSEGKAGSSNQRRAESNNGGGEALAPVLHIEYAVAGPGDQVTMSQSVVVLDSLNWEAGVEVTVWAVDDLVIETDPHMSTLINRVTSPDADWNYLSADNIVVSISENECGTWLYMTYDYNTDCFVDLGDLTEMVAVWMTCSRPNDSAGLCVDYR